MLRSGDNAQAGDASMRAATQVHSGWKRRRCWSRVTIRRIVTHGVGAVLHSTAPSSVPTTTGALLGGRRESNAAGLAAAPARPWHVDHYAIKLRDRFWHGRSIDSNLRQAFARGEIHIVVLKICKRQVWLSVTRSLHAERLEQIARTVGMVERHQVPLALALRYWET